MVSWEGDCVDVSSGVVAEFVLAWEDDGTFVVVEAAAGVLPLGSVPSS